MEILKIINTSRIWMLKDIFLIPFGTMDHPCYIGQITLLSIVFRVVLTQTMTHVYTISITL